MTGCQWRYLPKEYPAWQHVYYYFNKWRRDGTWVQIHERLRAQVRQKAGRHKHPTGGCLDKHPTGGCLDSQSVKTTAVPGERGYDAAKKVVGRKRHILVDIRPKGTRVCCCAWWSQRPAFPKVPGQGWC